MRILHCLSRSTEGGGPAVVFMLVATLRKQYPDIGQHVVLPPEGPYVRRFRESGVETHEVALDTLIPMVFGKMQRLVQSIRPTVIHSHGKGAGFFARIVPCPGATRIHTFHGYHPPEGWKKVAYEFLEAQLLRRTDVILGISEEEISEVQRRFGIERGKAAVIPNVVDCNRVRKESRSRTPGISSSGRFTVLMIARNDPIKNYPLALETAKRVLEEDAGTRFVFAGLGEEDPGTLNLMKRYPGRVILADEGVPVAALLKKADCLLLTSKKEGRPLVVLEAFCMGRPVVGTDVPGIRGLVVHGQNGLLAGEDSRQCAEAILALCRDERLKRRLGAGARSYAQTMSLEEWARQYVGIYRRGRNDPEG